MLMVLLHSRKVPTRNRNHWSLRISEANPRGYSESQLRKIGEAPTLAEKMRIELDILSRRHRTEKGLLNRNDDEYSTDCIAAMEAEVRAEYGEGMGKEGSVEDDRGAAGVKSVNRYTYDVVDNIIRMMP
jgi:hypothetical protein